MNQNAYNEPLILGIVNYLEDKNLHLGYEILVEAIDINKSNLDIRKKFVIVALKSGLTNYADEMLAELKGKLSSSEYQNLNIQANELKETLAKDQW